MNLFREQNKRHRFRPDNWTIYCSHLHLLTLFYTLGLDSRAKIRYGRAHVRVFFRWREQNRASRTCRNVIRLSGIHNRDKIQGYEEFSTPLHTPNASSRGIFIFPLKSKLFLRQVCEALVTQRKPDWVAAWKGSRMQITVAELFPHEPGKWPPW